MALTIQLLGTPAVQTDQPAAPPVRGHKVWGLLAALLLSDAPPSRRYLADMLFPDAADPVRALRWNLSQLRRLLGPDAVLGGDPVALVLPTATVDVDVLGRGSWVEAVRLPGLDRELLEGLEFATAPGFELWLATERRRFAGAAAAVLREAAVHGLARGDASAAARYASRLVTLDAFDENAHVLLVRCLRAAGDTDAAEQHVAACTDLFRRELGVSPTPALRTAAAVSAHGEAHTMGRAAIHAQLDAGEAAVQAGALEVGLAALRRATVGARAADELDLLTRALVALGSALVHAARGSDEEGAAALHEAGALAARLGDRAAAALSLRELGYVDLLRGRYERARARLTEAAEFADRDESQLAWVEIVAGAGRSDVGEYPAALETLARGVERAGAADDRHAVAFGASFLGRAHLLRGELVEARRWLAESLDVARAGHWAAFAPWPEALLADAELRAGEVDQAGASFQHAMALGEQLGDPCWESISARGLGLVAVAQGRTDEGFALLDEAPRLCRRLPDSYLWIEAYALDALCDLAVVHAPQTAPTWIDLLDTVAGRSGMRELLVRAALHRARLGQDGALQAARTLARSIDNPLLSEALAATPALPR